MRLLKDAIAATDGPRNVEYGPPLNNFANVAELWTAYLRARYGIDGELTPEDVAWFNVLQKIARTFNGTASDDTYTDAAAYSAIAGEVRQ